MEDPRKRQIRDHWDAIWNHGDLEAVDGLMASGYVRRARDRPPQTVSDLKETVVAVRAAFPDLHLHVEDMLQEDNRVVTRWRVTGTHMASFLGAPPTHEAVNLSGMTWSTFRDERVVSDWLTWDAEDMIRALGIMAIGWAEAVR